MQHQAEWIEPFSTSLEELDVVCLDIYGPVKLQNNRKNKIMRFSLLEKINQWPKCWDLYLLHHKAGTSYWLFMYNFNSTHATVTVS